MSSLPSGTVTFLFTDVEGSTKLLHELGAEDYSRVLADHRRALRDAFAANRGVEVDTQGDAFFVAFATAPDALAAAAQARDGLAPGPIHVRMGIHTGTAHLGEEGYVGIDVHRAARIASSGHGGQVLVSAATAALVPSDGLRDLGEHRLKDLAAPERIYQFGDGDFPPLNSLHRTNLPIPSTPFLGRARELDVVRGLLTRADVRFLTLTGPGGTGKTRLALQAAAESSNLYPGGVFWVPLAPLRDPQLVLETARQAVGARDGLAEHIGDATTLLVFDNFEHLTEAAADVARLLGSCSGLDLLVTSREPLHVAGEQEYPVPTLSRADALGLFTTRAQAVRPDFGGDSAVVDICRRLDDLPLALELAAARVKALSPAQILERLEHRLPLLTGGARDAPERQRTLRATIEWSYDLLTDEEKSLFARLAVFRGGCTFDAAEEVVGASLDDMQSLVDKSLLRHSQERFWMLETIREYAVERLEIQGRDSDSLRQRHAEYFLRLAEEAEPHLTGPQQASWLERLEPEHDNFRISLESLRHSDSGEELRLAGALLQFWYVHGHLREGSRRLQDALAAHDDQSPPRLKALLAAGLLAHRLGDYERAATLGQERLDLARGLGDAEAVASSMIALGLAADGFGDMDRVAAAFKEAADLARAGGYTRYLAIATDNLGSLLVEQGDYTQGRPHLEEAKALFCELGDERMVAAAVINLAVLAAREGRDDDAEALLHQGLEYVEAKVDKELAIWCLQESAARAVSSGRAERAARLTGAVESLRQETGHVAQREERRVDEQTRNALASELDEEHITAALAAGREMTFEQVMAYVLQD
ncbi:MAG TPA: adenylate/guanylate cyclase domain-containing protein [Candidatus Limnocylindrales bacterium]|nr:adenylate/guanylate cyclase domain-containing protein [Candidatus Limnocylindrales bacterium]